MVALAFYIGLGSKVGFKELNSSMGPNTKNSKTSAPQKPKNIFNIYPIFYPVCIFMNCMPCYFDLYKAN